MKKTQPAAIFFAAAACLAATSCENDIPTIGSGIRPADVTITVDSATFNLNGRSVEAPAIDARSTTTLLGSINTPEYGKLNCSYVTQLLPAASLTLPDTVAAADLDSVRLILRVPTQGITGDSLAMQQATVYRLTSPLTSSLTGNYDPEGKYEKPPLGVRNYTFAPVSIADETNTKNNLVSLRIPLPLEMGVKLVEQYRSDPSMFEWPQTFAKEFPGLYVESSFGKGCMANVTNTGVYLYSHHITKKYVDEGDTTVYKDVTVRDSVCVLTSAPEVLSSSLVKYTPSQKVSDLAATTSLVTTPGGYATTISFPTKELLRKYAQDNVDLGVINNLTFKLPASRVSNTLGIGVPTYLLMVPVSQAATFFTDGKIPDNLTSFAATYSSTTGVYQFSSMREYIKAMLQKGIDNLTEDDTEFMLLPVTISTESRTNEDGTTSEVYTSCVPYINAPAMVELHTDKALIVFTFSNQTIR